VGHRGRWRRRALGALLCAAVGGSLALPAVRAADSSAVDCESPAPSPDPKADPNAWRQRDAQNLLCATQRQQDELSNPAFLRKWAVEDAKAEPQVAGVLLGQAAEPTRPHVNPIYPNPTAKVGDPFRMPDEWEAAGRGQVERFSIIASTGAKLVARLYSPNAVPNEQPLPAIAFIPGLQSYNEVNEWFAEGMAEAGYVVLILDPQGQGDSENLPHNPDGSINCSASGCPNAQTNDKPETASAIEFLLSKPSQPYKYAVGANAAGTLTYNPLWARVDDNRIGIAGHSLGAIAVTPIGQEDPRVKAVVSYDNIDAKLPAADLASIHAPTLFFGVDYAFPSVLTPKDPSSPPDPDQHIKAAYSQVVAAGVDAMAIDTRASTHYEFGYQPFPASFQASRYGERVTFSYSLAWFDRYLKGDTDATKRLTELTFDGSADVHSIGAGTFDQAAAAADPANASAGNVPYKINGKCVANLLSFYYHSAYRLEGGALTSTDMRARSC
jgi:dienelactone hydrolase